MIIDFNRTYWSDRGWWKILNPIICTIYCGFTHLSQVFFFTIYHPYALLLSLLPPSTTNIKVFSVYWVHLSYSHSVSYPSPCCPSSPSPQLWTCSLPVTLDFRIERLQFPMPGEAWREGWTRRPSQIYVFPLKCISQCAGGMYAMWTLPGFKTGCKR